MDRYRALEYLEVSDSSLKIYKVKILNFLDTRTILVKSCFGLALA